jgi:superfamily II DNA/RNA helicase
LPPVTPLSTVLPHLAPAQERPDYRTLILCTSPATVDRLVPALAERLRSGDGGERRLRALRAIHPDVAASERAATLEAFSAPKADSPTARAKGAMVLVATDRAVRARAPLQPRIGPTLAPLSPPTARLADLIFPLGHLLPPHHTDLPPQVRGLDFPRLEHLCLFDFPRDAAEYLRRVGSATRGPAAPARLTMLAVGRQLSFARALLALDEQGRALDLEHEQRS